jgi:triosephosphate isomerase
VRIPLVAGNWKMNKTIGEALTFSSGLSAFLKEETRKPGWPEILIFPPFTALPALSGALAETEVKVGAQNLSWEKRGAFTGEISGSMLKDAGCEYVIAGHSERRHIFGETDEVVGRKVRAALDADLHPILCVGETFEQREAGETLAVCRTMTEMGLAPVTPDEVGSVVVAYEPVWAIGTGRDAKPDDAEEVIDSIRDTMARMFKDAAKDVRILYGGSVKSINIRGFMLKETIDGALIGGSSLDPEEFLRIVVEVQKTRPAPKSFGQGE